MADLFKKLHDKRVQLYKQLSDPAAVGVWKMVVDKYSDQAHFIYELLQNSDDAGATEVRIILFADKLYYIHNGNVPFTITDVDDEERGVRGGHLNAITSIGASTKDGTNSIGKFGVGFKSVFQYTDVPHIEDDNFCFRIENYIVPERDESIPLVRKEGETLFAIPFREPNRAFSEILYKLKHLRHPLLFLRKLSKISWETDGGEKGEYERKSITAKSFATADYTFEEEKQEIGDESTRLYHHIFKRGVSSAEKSSLNVSVVYAANEDGSLVTFSAEEEPAYCYFPTKEHTDLNFLIHAPFLLTDSREGIKRGEAWNDALLEQLATLATDALTYFAQMRTTSGEVILDDKIFSIIPIDEKKFFKSIKGKREAISYFSVFYDRFVEKLAGGEPLLRSLRGYVDASHTIHSFDKQLVELLGEARSLLLLPAIGREGLDWAFLTFTEADQEVFNYLKAHNLLSIQVTLDVLLDDMSVAFLQQQSMEWLKRFYAYLTPFVSEENAEEIRSRLLIYCADGRFLPAYDRSGKQLVFLSAGTSNAFTVVSQALLEDLVCMRLFKQLGITHPDKRSEVESVVLPRYEAQLVSVDDYETIYRDMNLFVDAYQSFKFMDSRVERYLQLFADVPVFPARNKDGVCSFRKASEIYVDIQLLTTYLSADASAMFLDSHLVKNGFEPEKREAFYKFISAVGVSFGIRLKKVKRSLASAEMFNLIVSQPNLRKKDKTDMQVEDCEIDGFVPFLMNINKQASVAFFSLLATQIERQSTYMFQLSLEGHCSTDVRSRQKVAEEVIVRTTAWHWIFSERWIYDVSGRLCKPSEIGTVSNLAVEYEITTPDILFFLGIEDDPAMRGLTPEQRRAVALIRSFEKVGVTMEHLERLLEKIKEGKVSELQKVWSKEEE